MALIVCPECGKNFSDKAPACPECGCPTSEITKTSSNDNGMLLIANNAFTDSRYDEAYQLFTQLYSKDQTSPTILVRLGLATAAKDYFNNGIPNTTVSLLTEGFAIAKKNAVSQDQLIESINGFINDVDKVVYDTTVALTQDLNAAINQTSSMRSTKSMVADTLFAPVVSANRNLYEDRRTAENNTRILTNALNNKKMITNTLQQFKSCVLNIVVKTFDTQLDSSVPFYNTLNSFASTAEDAKCFDALFVTTATDSKPYGLGFGEERVYLQFENSCCYLMLNGKPQNRGGFAPPKGTITITNYRIEYSTGKDKTSFSQSILNIKDIKVGGILNVYIVFVLDNGYEVHVSPIPAGTQATHAAVLREQFNLQTD